MRYGYFELADEKLDFISFIMYTTKRFGWLFIKGNRNSRIIFNMQNGKNLKHRKDKHYGIIKKMERYRLF